MHRKTLALSPGAVLAALLIASFTGLAPNSARADAPPSPWISEDIGHPAQPGSTQVDANGVWTIQGASTSVFGSGHITYQHLQGDGSIIAHYVSGGAGVYGVMAGLTVREDDTLGSPSADYAVCIYGTVAGARFQRGIAWDNFMNSGPYNTPRPVSLRLQRLGNAITGFYSTDGTLWSPDFDPVPLPSLASDALFGLTISGPNSTQLYTAKFDQVQVQAGAVLVTSLRACAGDGMVALQWDPLPNALGYDLYVYHGPAGARADQFVKLNSQPVAGTTYTDRTAGLVDGTQVLYGVAAVLPGAGGTPVEGPLEVLPVKPGTRPPGYLGCSLLEGPVSGSAAYDPISSGITLQGSGFGVGIEGPSLGPGVEGSGIDGCYFLNQALDGDQQITVRMLSRPNGGQAGLMIRESLQVGARQLTLGIDTGSGVWSPQGLATEWRPGTYQRDTSQTLVPLKNLSGPIVLRLTRQGNTITPAYSTDDGQSFTAGETITLDPPLPGSLYYGLEATSSRLGIGSRNSLNMAQFEALTVQPVSGP